jgi:hypothetical protein
MSASEPDERCPHARLNDEIHPPCTWTDPETGAEMSDLGLPHHYASEPEQTPGGALYDAQCLIEAQMRKDARAAALIIYSADLQAVALLLSKMMAEMVWEEGATRQQFHEWVADAVNRPDGAKWEP